MEVGNLSIVSGWLPVALFWLTVVVCLVAVVLRRDVLMEFAIGIPIGIVIVVLLFVALHLFWGIPSGAPQSLYIWLVIACLLTGLVIAGWHTAHWPRRISGIAAIILSIVAAGSAVNQTFDYYPTVDRLLGKTANHFLSNSALNELRAQVAKTGQLPNHGATLSVSIPPTTAHLKYTPRPAYVWVPPAWFLPNHPQLPVIELLHGTPGQPSDWTRASYADATSLAFAEQNHGEAPILVMPDVNGSFSEDTECVNSPKYGEVETYLTKDVPAFIQKNFNAKTTVGAMAVAGLSEGGTSAVGLALTNPKEYPTFASYSGLASPSYQADSRQESIDILFGGSEAAFNAHDPQYLLSHHTFDGMAGWFESGAQDPPSLAGEKTLQALAAKAGIDTCFTYPPGAHDFGFWKDAFATSLPWISWRLKLTPEPTNIAARCVSGST